MGRAGIEPATLGFVGVESIKVPAFPGPVRAAEVRTEVTQAGAIGDPTEAASGRSGVSMVWGR